jgi:hypothetical protein
MHILFQPFFIPLSVPTFLFPEKVQLKTFFRDISALKHFPSAQSP